MLRCRIRMGAALHALRRDRGATAAVEFALIAPIMILMLLATFDITRALIAWEETYAAAGAIAQAAEKLSVTSGISTTSLTATQMEQAMTTIYAEMPGLNKGKGGGSLSGDFSVTLSGIVYSPLCSTGSGCATQTPYTLWSTYLKEGGTQNISSATSERACGALSLVQNFPNNSNQLLDMVGWGSSGGGVPLAPQVVADVEYIYTPLTTLFLTSIPFWASVTFPSPLGGVNQEITYNTEVTTGTDVTPAVVSTCTVPSN